MPLDKAKTGQQHVADGREPRLSGRGSFTGRAGIAAAAHPQLSLRWRSTFQLGDPQPQERDGQDQGVYRQPCQHDREDGVQDTKNAEGRTQIHCYPQ
jgi:hypothetical protein